MWLSRLTFRSDARVCAIYGGAEAVPQLRKIAAGIEIVVCNSKRRHRGSRFLFANLSWPFDRPCKKNSGLCFSQGVSAKGIFY